MTNTFNLEQAQVMLAQGKDMEGRVNDGFLLWNTVRLEKGVLQFYSNGHWFRVGNPDTWVFRERAD
ncbi:MAG: hypothetical protein JSS66_06715 [Armatimonadetes bacterium]|nr:hypothetical protein [Armatimonadota bacterium]